MPKKKEKVSSFVLVIDEERAVVLNAMFNAASRNGELVLELMMNNLGGAFGDLGLDFAKKLHEAGWCPDENCTYGESN